MLDEQNVKFSKSQGMRPQTTSIFISADEFIQSNASSGNFSKVSIICIKTTSFTGTPLRNSDFKIHLLI